MVTQAALAAHQATRTIPIVMVGVGDPVGAGLVASLARPAGNVTGTSTVAADVVGKQLELVRQVLPRAVRVAVLWNPANRAFRERQVAEVKAAATTLRLKLELVPAQAVTDLDGAFAVLARARPQALLVLGDPLFLSHIDRIAELAMSQRLPTVGGSRDYAAGGILVTYGPDYPEGFRDAAGYVSRILEGARPDELPVAESTKFELVVNARTARALGVSIPASVVARADHVIE